MHSVEKISLKQLFFLVFAYTVASSIILPPGKNAGNDAIIAIVLAFGESLIPILAYLKLSQRYPNATIIEINEIVLGNFVGRIASFFLIVYFFETATTAIYILTDFLSTQILFTTPSIVLALPVTLLGSWAALSGIEVIGRCSELIVPFSLSTALFITLLTIPQTNLAYLRPLFQTPWKEFLWITHSIATYPFGQLIVFTTVLPFVNQPEKNRKTFLLAVIAANLFFLTVVIRNIAILGPTIKDTQHPTFTAASLIDIVDIITRAEVAVSTTFIIIGFLKISLLSHAILTSVGQLFRLRTVRPIGVPLAVLISVTSLVVSESITHQADFLQEIYPIYVLPFQYILPVALLVFSYIFPAARRKAQSPSRPH